MSLLFVQVNNTAGQARTYYLVAALVNISGRVVVDP